MIILSINTNNFAHILAKCKSEDQSSYTSLNKRTQKEASSHLSASLPEATPVPSQLFCTNFNILKAALIYTSWWGSKGAAFVTIADRGSEKHQSWLQADTGTKTAYSFSWLFARRHPTHNFRKISGIGVVKSIPDGNISGVFYFSLFINLYKQLQSTLNMHNNMHMGKMYTVKKKRAGFWDRRKVKNIFCIFLSCCTIGIPVCYLFCFIFHHLTMFYESNVYVPYKWIFLFPWRCKYKI